MTDEKSEKCDCNCKSGCCGAKSGSLLLNFMLLIIILLLSGIFYTAQGAISMCPMMKSGPCATGKIQKAPCFLSSKMEMDVAK